VTVVIGDEGGSIMLPTLDGAFYRRLAVTAAALAIFRLGSVIPIPGLSLEVVSEVVRGGGGTVGRLSLFALGITPLLNALILAELLKIVAPSVRAWELAAWTNGVRVRNVVYGLALLLAILQAGGVSSGLEGVAGLVPEPGTAFRVTCVFTMVAGTALVVGLAAVIDRAGLGSGLWLVFLAPTLAELPQNLATIAQLYDMGQYSLGAILRAAAFTAIAVAGVVSIVLVARGAAATSAACVWTPLLAYAVLAWLLIGIGLVISFGNVEGAMAVAAPGSLVRYLVLPAVFALIAWLYVRSTLMAGQPNPVRAMPIAAVLAAIALAAELLQSQLQTALPLGSVQVVIATVVATRMLIDWKVLGGEERPPAAASEPVSPNA
jgi:preprotein translocase subunit SecY